VQHHIVTTPPKSAATKARTRRMVRRADI
jgi:hypothetical protein